MGDSPADIRRLFTCHHPSIADGRKLRTASSVTKRYVDAHADDTAAKHRLTLERYALGTDGSFNRHGTVSIHRLAIGYRPAAYVASEHARGCRARRPYWLCSNLAAPAGPRCAWS